LQEYRDGLIQLSIDKYFARKKTNLAKSEVKQENLNPSKFYYSLNRGFYKSSAKYPVEMIVGSGLYFLNSATKNELLFYSMNYDAKTSQLEMTFFVSKTDSKDFKSDFSGPQWFENIHFFHSLEDYLEYKFEVDCSKN
jgi:hypothetical protein